MAEDIVQKIVMTGDTADAQKAIEDQLLLKPPPFATRPRQFKLVK
jgi:hypothetical protein